MDSKKAAVDPNVVNYIESTQAIMYKQASEKNQLLKALNFKLDAMHKKGMITSLDRDKIKKEAKEDITSIVKNLEVPNFNRQVSSIGSIATKSNYSDGYDPISAFVNTY